MKFTLFTLRLILHCVEVLFKFSMHWTFVHLRVVSVKIMTVIFATGEMQRHDRI